MPRTLAPDEVIVTDNKVYTFNRCVHIERHGKGRYFGLTSLELSPLWDFDGNRGFLEWLIFRLGWYPVTVHKWEQERDGTR